MQPLFGAQPRKTRIMTAIEQQKAAREFAQQWQGKGNEKSDTHSFWFQLLRQVFGVENPEQYVEVEKPVSLDHTSYIDVYIPSTKVLIEQKSIDKDLNKGYKQSDDQTLTPYQQAKRYANELPRSEHPKWIITCNFQEFHIHDMDRPHDAPLVVLLKDLEKDYYLLKILVDEKDEHLKREMEVSFKAGNLVGIIYDKLLEQYIDKDSVATLKSLNILCVRLVFCLYAEDANLFGSKTAFHDYLAQFPANQIRRALIDLFQVLDTPPEQRDPYLDDALKVFPYVNGGLFSSNTTAGGAPVVIPQFTDELKQLLLDKASADFDWSEISPTIFGAVFESTINPETRRSGGMHYTSIENIHKVIDPLFFNDLKAEFEDIKQSLPKPEQSFNTARKVYELPLSAKQRLLAFQDKLAGLTFFDPACGSGNFLTESYVSLRRLENEVLRVLYGGQSIIGLFANPIKVNIHQFYGIEINDFAVSVATTALWIAEQQMLQETQKIASFDISPLPLKPYHNIIEGNALRIDWPTVIAPDKLNYIMGNPPFVGYSLQSKAQKDDMLSIYVDEKGKPYKTAGKIDYVAAWYWKAAEMMQKAASISPEYHSGSPIRAALVSTNSITQGEQVAAIWKPLFDRFGIHIDFAYRTFRWDSEADIKAHVHCVIIGFSSSSASDFSSKTIYLSDNQSIQAANINPYLIDAPDTLIDSRSKPLCDVPDMSSGGKPVEGGFLILSPEDKDELLQKAPEFESYVRPFTSGDDFINNKKRYCLWLVNCPPNILRSSSEVKSRIEGVREFRLASVKEATRRCADTPTLFMEVKEPQSTYLLIPATSSEKRRYIPIGYVDKSIIPNNAVQFVPNASLYNFGILTSNVHMAWMRIVCGRLEMRYRYSANIVYNNFPWPNPTDEQRARIETTAQAILDARSKYPDCSLADLYDEVTMPPELRKAHRDNDAAVMAAYGFDIKMSEPACVAELFKLYQNLTAK